MGPPKESPPFLVAEEDPPEEYGPWQWAAAFGRATGRFGADAFTLQEDGKLRCPCLGQPVVERSASRKYFHESWLSTSLIRPIASAVRSVSSAWQKAAKGNRARRVSAVRRLLPPPAKVSRKPVLLGPIRWVDVAGRALRRTWTTHWRSQYVEVIPLIKIPQRISPPPRPPRAVRSHHRWSWHDRLVRNAWWGPPQLRITVAGVPSFLAVS